MVHSFYQEENLLQLKLSALKDLRAHLRIQANANRKADLVSLIIDHLGALTSTELPDPVSLNLTNPNNYAKRARRYVNLDASTLFHSHVLVRIQPPVR